MDDSHRNKLQIRGTNGALVRDDIQAIKVEKEPINNPDTKLTREATTLLNSYNTPNHHKKEEKFKVGEVLSSAAFVYEKVRNAVDYKGEHLLRRNAIERILKRLLWEKPSLSDDPEALSRVVLKELIWARYLANDTLPITTQKEISKSLEKYSHIFSAIKKHFRDKKERKVWKEWFLGVASSEIEALIDPTLNEQIALSQAMKSWMDINYKWKDSEISDEDKSTQLSIATHRSLFKLDLARVRYFMVKKSYPNWTNNPNLDMDELIKSAQKIESYIDSEVQTRLYRYTQKFVAHFQVLNYVIRRNIGNPKAVLESKETLESQVRAVCSEKYEEIGKRVNTGIVRSIIYIFATKVLVALVTEVPFEIYVLGEIQYIPLIFNMAVPPLLMLIIGLSIRKPSEDNTKVILERINDFVYNSDTDITEFSVLPKKRNKVAQNIFSFFYFLFFLISFGGLTYLLYWLGYNPFSALIFYMFLSLVLLFGYRLKYNASELKAVEVKEGFLSHFVTNLSLPFLKAGLWLSDQVGRVNILLLVFDFLIEAPLKSVLKGVDEWTGFVREQRDEVVDMPVK